MKSIRPDLQIKLRVQLGSQLDSQLFSQLDDDGMRPLSQFHTRLRVQLWERLYYEIYYSLTHTKHNRLNEIG